MRPPHEALPDEHTKRLLREADAFRSKIITLGENLDALPEDRQLLLFDLAPRIWP